MSVALLSEAPRMILAVYARVMRALNCIQLVRTRRCLATEWYDNISEEVKVVSRKKASRIDMMECTQDWAEGGARIRHTALLGHWHHVGFAYLFQGFWRQAVKTN
jgi:hypothetical protein